ILPDSRVLARNTTLHDLEIAFGSAADDHRLVAEVEALSESLPAQDDQARGRRTPGRAGARRPHGAAFGVAGIAFADVRIDSRNPLASVGEPGRVRIRWRRAWAAAAFGCRRPGMHRSGKRQ